MTTLLVQGYFGIFKCIFYEERETPFYLLRFRSGNIFNYLKVLPDRFILCFYLVKKGLFFIEEVEDMKMPFLVEIKAQVFPDFFAFLMPALPLSFVALHMKQQPGRHVR